MARRTPSAGLTIGQVLTLTLGFLVASLLIFVFGIWVGKDLVERRLAQEERIVRKPADRTELAQVKEPEHAPDVDVTGQETLKAPAVIAAAATATAPRLVAPPTESMKGAVATATAVKAAATPTTRPVVRHTAAPTVTRSNGHSAEEWADAGWTVQVYATTEPNQATALARRLLSKGYDAYTLQAPMRGQIWYRVRVGRFASRDRAREMELKLKKEEGLEAAYVTAQ